MSIMDEGSDMLSRWVSESILVSCIDAIFRLAMSPWFLLRSFHTSTRRFHKSLLITQRKNEELICALEDSVLQIERLESMCDSDSLMGIIGSVRYAAGWSQSTVVCTPFLHRWIMISVCGRFIVSQAPLTSREILFNFSQLCFKNLSFQAGCPEHSSSEPE